MIYIGEILWTYMEIMGCNYGFIGFNIAMENHHFQWVNQLIINGHVQ